MFIYKLICIPTKRVYVGTCEDYPTIKTIDMPREVQRDIDNFGENNFSVRVICELKNTEKAQHKAEAMMGREPNKYEVEPERDTPEYEIVEQFPFFPLRG